MNTADRSPNRTDTAAAPGHGDPTASPEVESATTFDGTTYTVTVSTVDQHGDPGHRLAYGAFLYLTRACAFAGEQATVLTRTGHRGSVWAELTEQSCTDLPRELLAVRGTAAAVTAAAARVTVDPTTPVSAVR